MRTAVTPVLIPCHVEGEPHQWTRTTALSFAAELDGHVLGTLCAVTMALLTNRLDLCIQGLFEAGKSKSMAVLILALIEIDTSEATRWLSWYGVGLACADKLPVVVRIPAGPLGSLKSDLPKGNGRRPQKRLKSTPLTASRSFLYVRKTQALDPLLTYSYGSTPRRGCLGA